MRDSVRKTLKTIDISPNRSEALAKLVKTYHEQLLQQIGQDFSRWKAIGDMHLVGSEFAMSPS